MVREVLEKLKLTAPLKTQARYIDATLGTAGHSIEIIKRGGIVLGIDADKEMLGVARRRLKQACPSAFKLVNANFIKIDEIAQEAGFTKVDGILFDLGVSNLQLTSRIRGFSFGERTTPLDMRLDPKIQAVTGVDLLNSLRRDQLEALLGVVETKFLAKKLAQEIVLRRKSQPIKTVGDFLEVIQKVKRPKGKLHPATKAFLALRLAVNSELENLRMALPKAFGLLRKGGRLVVITFHSGEDSIVKHFFKQVSKNGKARLLTKKPIKPSDEEIKKNPKARSAKLRCLEKIIN
jgi:16S rRNA (cytosine1402-N4)-methyltransferase